MEYDARHLEVTVEDRLKVLCVSLTQATCLRKMAATAIMAHVGDDHAGDDFNDDHHDDDDDVDDDARHDGDKDGDGDGDDGDDNDEDDDNDV